MEGFEDLYFAEDEDYITIEIMTLTDDGECDDWYSVCLEVRDNRFRKNLKFDISGHSVFSKEGFDAGLAELLILADSATKTY